MGGLSPFETPFLILNVTYFVIPAENRGWILGADYIPRAISPSRGPTEL